MKSIVWSVILVLTAIRTLAQPPIPETCFTSDWNGLGLPTLNSQLYFCSEAPSVPVGTYGYWNPLENTPNSTAIGVNPISFEEWNWNNIYGLKGRYGINFPSFLGDGDTLSAQVFETKYTTSSSTELQNIENQEFHFYGGNYKFNIMHLSYSTKVVVHPGAYIEIHTALTSDIASTLEIMPGGVVKLKSSRDNIAVTNINGDIEGRLTKEIYFDVSDNWQDVANAELRFVFNPGLYDVDLHQVALDVQDAATVELSGSNQEPYVQIGYWGRRQGLLVDETEYDFTALHTYESFNSDIELSVTNPDDSAFFVGNAVLNADGALETLTPGQEDVNRTTSIGGHFYNWNSGVSILPIYPPTDAVGSSDAQLLQHWFGSEDFIEFQNDQISADSDISSFSKTPQELDRQFIISLTNCYPAIDDFKIEVTGKFDNAKNIALENWALSSTISVATPLPGQTYTVLENPDSYDGVSTFFDATAILNPPLSLLSQADMITHAGGNARSNFRGIDFTGLSPINNRTGNYLNTYQTLFEVFAQGPVTQLALFDMAPIMGRQDARQFTEDSNGVLVEQTSGFGFPIPVANLLIWDDTAPQFPGVEVVDFYNIEDMDIFYAIGDTIRPDEMLAYNFNNPLDSRNLDGSGYNNLANFQEYEVDWYNKNGYDHAGGSGIGDTVYATQTNVPAYRRTEQVYVNNKPVLKSFANVRERVGLGNVNNNLYDWTIEELNEMNEMTLIRLAGVTTEDDTLTIAIVPVATDPEYSATGEDLFETSVAVNPIMHLYAPPNSRMTNRKWGSYARGVNDFNDTLRLVVDLDALEFVSGGLQWQELFIDTPVRQVGACGLNGDNLVVIPEDGSADLLTWNPNFQYPIELDSEYEYEDPESGTTDYGNGKIVDIYFKDVQSDFNGDGCVTVADLIVFLQNFGEEVEQGNFTQVQSDLNCDGNVTTSDMLIMLSHFGTCLSEDDFQSGELPEILAERGIFYMSHNNDHIPYNIIDDYSGFTNTQREFLREWPAPANISIVDDLNIVVHNKVYSRPGYNPYTITLPYQRPTSDQLGGTEARFSYLSPQTTPGYRIYIEWAQPAPFPGLDLEYSTHICLGCIEDPEPQFPQVPIFVAN